MIKQVTGDLLEADVDVIIHQANLEHTFGAGIARAIKEKFPYAYDADLMTTKGSKDKLGSVSFAWPEFFNPFRELPKIPKGKPAVANLYSQTNLGPSHTSYDAMFEGLITIRNFVERHGLKTVGIPYKIGCGLADGNWNIVKVIIEEAFKDSDLDVTIYKLPGVE